MIGKNFVIWVLWLSAVFISNTFAYQPTQSLQTKLEVVSTSIEQLINVKWESVRIGFVGALEWYKVRLSGNERAQYIISYLLAELSEKNDATSAKGYFWSYTIIDANYGTEVAVVVDSSTRSITSNARPNHDTGNFPNPWNPNTITEQEKFWSFPVVASYQWNETWTREAGVAINWIKFEPETGERVECESGETYRIEAVQEEVDLWLDHQHAHVQPTGEYHYHWVSQDLVTFWSQVASNEDLVHVWFAADWFHMYYSKSWAYTPSFKVSSTQRTWTACEYRETPTTIEWTTPDGTYKSDREFDSSIGDLDACSGIEMNGQYAYILTNEYPFISRCLNGEVEWQGGPWWGVGGPGWAWPRGQWGPWGWRPGWPWWQGGPRWGQ